jgi:SRSO17 transposase
MNASIETILELWAVSLGEIKARVAASAGLFLDSLLGPERRKTGWMRAEAAGDLGPWRQQAILGRGRWEADALRDVVRNYAVETLAEEDAVLVIDETGFLKQGQSSCGVGRQDTGSAGKITNCQIGVSAPMFRGTATPSSIARSTCPGAGPTTLPAWLRPMFLWRAASRPGPPWHCR